MVSYIKDLKKGQITIVVISRLPTFLALALSSERIGGLRFVSVYIWGGRAMPMVENGCVKT